MKFHQKDIDEALSYLRTINAELENRRETTEAAPRSDRLQKVLVANRGEIAKRFFLALHEENIPSVAIVTEADIGQSWYDFAGEAVLIGPAGNYTNIPVVIAAGLLSGAGAIYPGYGFLSENADFPETICEIQTWFGRELLFMGPSAAVMRRVGNKLAARELAQANNVPLFSGSGLISGVEEARAAARSIGYPVLVKLDAGGGGKGMVPVYAESEMDAAVESCRRIGRDLYDNTDFYLEKFIVEPVHMEVQIFNGLAVGIRKCAVQRRNQKIIEESGHSFLDNYQYLSMLAAAERVASIAGYHEGAGAGTVEFLYDAGTGQFGFLEINTRLQVEYAVTDQSLGIDLVKWQILFFDGRERDIPTGTVLRNRFTIKEHAIECRIYAEDPATGYAPSPGRIQELDLPTFNGIRCDFGFKAGDRIVPNYDPMIGKLIAYGPSRQETLIRLERALQELYIKGIQTNIPQLLEIVRHQEFIGGAYTNRLLDDHPRLGGLAGQTDTTDRRSRTPIVLAGLAEYVDIARRKAREFMVVGDIEAGIRRREILLVPTTFDVEIDGENFAVEFIRISLSKFHVYLDGRYNGEIEITGAGDNEHNFLIRFGTRIMRVRVDKKAGNTNLRIKDQENKFSYYRLKVRALGEAAREDPPGMVRAPFQGTFVKSFQTDEKGNVLTGARVAKGEPLLVISAMKMETVLTAPIAGRISRFVEDGLLARLRLGVTPDGKVQGRGLAEGEMLFVIESEAEVVAGAEGGRGRLDATEHQGERHTFELLFYDDLEEAVEREPARHIASMLTFLDAYFKGITPHSWIVEKLYDLAARIDLKVYQRNLSEDVETQIAGIILQYATIKQLFSPYYETNFSAFEELSSFAANWREKDYRPPDSFLPMLENVFALYGVKTFLALGEEDSMEMQEAFLAIHNSYHAVTSHSSIIQYLIRILSSSRSQNSDVYESLQQVVLAEQAELDTTLLELTQKTVEKMFPWDAADFPAEARPFAPGLPYMEETTGLQAEIVSRPAPAGLVPDSFPLWSAQVLKEYLEILERNYRLTRLHSPDREVAVFRLEHRATGKREYAAYGLVDLEDMSFLDIPALKRAFDRAGQAAGRLLGAYHALAPGENNRIEILACRCPVHLALTGDEFGRPGYFTLRQLLAGTVDQLGSANTRAIIVHLDVLRGQTAERKKIQFFERAGELTCEFLFDTDVRSPYCLAEIPADQKLFGRGKWPVDHWAAESFDPGTMREIRVDSLDQVAWTNPKTGVSGFRPVAAKIFQGEMHGWSALFFMKDSRIAGGSTGNLEGLKYVAACYLGYVLNLPVYVWNDGAGANVREGMISLNRAAEGFLMNALLGANLAPEEFRRYTERNPDPDLQALFRELDGRFPMAPRTARRRFFVVAISVGSSAGLDVYGASQAAIQVMLDSDESYRVLTGSNVIKSVMGEDISNLDIGGARIMGKWTGIVDLIAHDKFELLGTVRRIHNLFGEETALDEIARPQRPVPTRLRPGQVISETVLEENVDRGDFWPFKKDYYGAGSLVAGFARLGGRRVFLLGTRSRSGIRSFAATTRAVELLETARKTATPRVFIFGRRLLGDVINQDPKVVRARYDFFRQITRSGDGLRINIVTESEGLLAGELHAHADAVIFVKNGESGEESETPLLAARTATFVRPTLAAGMDLARALIGLLDPLAADPAAAGAGEPSVPVDAAVPFDILGAVIHPVLDAGSFVEFFKEMNDPEKGPGLVVGLGRLAGQTVGVIADNPAVMSGAPDAPGTEKFRVFTEFLNERNIPLLMLSNSPGFVPGTKQERLRVQAIGARSLDVNILGRIPVVSVVLNQNYGGRQIHAFSKFLRPGIVYLALDRAILAVMGAQSAFDLFEGARYRSMLENGQADDARRLSEDFMSQFNAKSVATSDARATGVLDWTIPDPRELRGHLLRGLELARERVGAVWG